MSIRYSLLAVRCEQPRIEFRWGGVNESIGIGKVRVQSRDIVVADANGVVFVPRHRAREVFETVRQIEASEGRIRELIAGGSSIAEAREKLGYHLLQRKEFPWDSNIEALL